MRDARPLLLSLAVAFTLGFVCAATLGCDSDTEGSTAAPVVEDTGQTWTLKLSFGFTEQASLYAAHVVPWSKAVEAATGGRVTIEHYGGGVLARDDQQYNALLSGVCDIAVVEPEYTSGVFPVFEVGSMPRMFLDPAAATASMWDLYEEYGDQEFDDVVLVGVTCISGSQYIGNKEVVLPEDLRGVKMRSGGKVEGWVLRQLGSDSIDIMVGDLAMSMEGGLADGAFLSWSYIMAVGVEEYTTYRTHLDLIYRPWVIIMNKEVWDTMPRDIQDAIASVSTREDSILYSVVNEEITRDARARLESYDQVAGHPPIYEPTEDELQQWKQALTGVWDIWATELKTTGSPYAAKGQEILAFLEERSVQYEQVYDSRLDEARKILESSTQPGQ